MREYISHTMTVPRLCRDIGGAENARNRLKTGPDGAPTTSLLLQWRATL
jgi:hypothetical protein